MMVDYATIYLFEPISLYCGGCWLYGGANIRVDICKVWDCIILLRSWDGLQVMV